MKKLLLLLFVLSGLNCLSAITKVQLFNSIDKPCFVKVFGQASDEVVESQDELGNTLLLIACKRDDFEVVQTLLLYSNIDEKINVPNNEGETPFDWAARNKNKKLQEILLLHGAKQVVAVQRKYGFISPKMCSGRTLERATQIPLPELDTDSVRFLSPPAVSSAKPTCLGGPACIGGMYYGRSTHKLPGVKVSHGIPCPGGSVCLNGVESSSDEEGDIGLSECQVVRFRPQVKVGGNKKRDENCLFNLYSNMLARMMLSEHPGFIQLGECVRLQSIGDGVRLNQYYEGHYFDFATMFKDLRRVYLNICLLQKKNLDDNSYQQFRKKLSLLYEQLKNLLGIYQVKHNDIKGISVATERDQLKSRC